MSIKYNKFTSLGSRHNYSNALHQYLNAISDEELFNLRKKVPTIKTIFDNLEKDLVSFIDNHDIENIKNIVFKNCYQISYESALKEKERDTDLIDGLLKDQKKSFFSGKHKKLINEKQLKIKDLNDFIINPFKQNKAFDIENSFEGTTGTYVYIFWEAIPRQFSNVFHDFFSETLSDFKLKFKNIYYKLENIEFYFWGPRFGKEFNPDDYMSIIKTDIFDTKKGSVFSEKAQMGYCVNFKFYEYLTRWHKPYYPYFLGNYAYYSPQEIIDEIDVVLFSRHRESVINYIKNNL